MKKRSKIGIDILWLLHSTGLKAWLPWFLLSFSLISSPSEGLWRVSIQRIVRDEEISGRPRGISSRKCRGEHLQWSRHLCRPSLCGDGWDARFRTSSSTVSRPKNQPILAGLVSWLSPTHGKKVSFDRLETSKETWFLCNHLERLTADCSTHRPRLFSAWVSRPPNVCWEACRSKMGSWALQKLDEVGRSWTKLDLTNFLKKKTRKLA